MKLFHATRSLCAVDAAPGLRVLRTAVKLLLAFVLVFNGFFMPVAMAHHASAQAVAATAVSSACHGDDGQAAADGTHRGGDHAQPAGDKHRAPCCSSGSCQCGCVTAASVLALPAAGSIAVAVPLRVVMTTTVLPTGRYTLPLRPPIA